MTFSIDDPAATADTGPEAAKAELRRRARALRRAVAAAEGGAAATALAGHWPLLATPAVPAVVAGYWPLADEIDPRPLMAALAGRGAALALPVVVGRDRPLVFRAWAAGDGLEEGAHGTRHPLPERPELRPDLVLVPLLAFDGARMRLGYGGGFYDRTLALLRAQGPVVAVGLAFAAQRVERVPSAGHDQALDLVLTQNGAAG